jgi:uncharacterized protein YhaN
MRLIRIQAERFGAIDGRALGDLSPSLTVVEGPNEAGKSSFTALVRHILYGFPTAASQDAPFLSAAGKRTGRLIFGDEVGEWVVERSEGTHGGPVSVRALTGPPRERLVEELTSAVSANAYRVVFGFGLSEMDQIAGAKGREDNVLAQLYAASAGLGVSLLDVRTKLAADTEALWKPRGSATELNAAKAERDRLRAELRGLEAEAEALRPDLARFESVEAGLANARSIRTETRAAAERIGRLIADAERLTTDSEKAAADSERFARDAATARAEAARIAPDPAVLAAGATVDALVEGLSGFRQQVAAAESQRIRLSTLDARLRAEVADTGWTEEQALAAAGHVGIAAEIEEGRDALTKAQTRVDIARSAREASSGRDVAEPIRTTRAFGTAGTVMAAIGAIGALGGFVMAATTMPAAGTALLLGAVLVAVAGVVLILVGRRPVGGTAAPGRSAGAGADAEFTAASQALEEARAAWSDRVRARGLGDGTEEPVSIAARYNAARNLRSGVEERDGLVAELATAASSAEAYIARVQAELAPLLGLEGAALGQQDVVEVVSRSRALVAGAREAEVAATAARAAAERAERDAAESDAVAQGAHARAAAVIADTGAGDAGLEGAREIEVAARTLAEDAAEEFDRLSRESAGLHARLDADRRDNAVAELRLALASLDVRIAAGVEKYAVLQMAMRLLTMAKERYERDRQPEVMRRAGAALSRITSGHYDRIAAALDTDAIEVFDSASGAHAPRLLSRGTAEQVYLALRIGLLDQLGAVGAGLPVLMDDVLVNFSPDRAEPAARAIADLATRRQVVFFTCHPAAADLLCGVAPDAVRLRIGPTA